LAVDSFWKLSKRIVDFPARDIPLAIKSRRKCALSLSLSLSLLIVISQLETRKMQPRENHFGHVRAESSEGRRWRDAGVAAIFGISPAMGRRNTRSNKKSASARPFPG
jgi:hypothetical protein